MGDRRPALLLEQFAIVGRVAYHLFVASVETPSERVVAALAQAEEDLLFAPLPQALSAAAGTDAFGFENIVDDPSTRALRRRPGQR